MNAIPPTPLLDRIRTLAIQRTLLTDRHDRIDRDRMAIASRLAIADAITAGLEKLTDQLFADLIHTIETQLTVALQEVLEQPLQLKVTRGSHSGRATISFHIEREGKAEDILRGQGGSVANVLSVGLRLLALTTLPEKEHRRFLVLDEQDCWLKPELVPRLVKIVQAAGKTLGFQVVMISHHDSAIFERYADRIIRFTPGADGVKANVLHELGAEDAD